MFNLRKLDHQVYNILLSHAHSMTNTELRDVSKISTGLRLIHCVVAIYLATYPLTICHSVTQYLIHTQVVVYRFNKSLEMGHACWYVYNYQNNTVITTVVINLSPLVPKHCKTCYEKDLLPQYCMHDYWFLRLLFMVKTTYGTVVLIIAK